MSENTPTPRTDAMALKYTLHLPSEKVPADFARQLERETLELRAQLLQAQAACGVKKEALKLFTNFCTYPVSKEIDKRGYCWRGEKDFDYAREHAVNALSHTTPATLLDEVVKALESAAQLCQNYALFDSPRVPRTQEQITHALRLLRGETGKPCP